MANDARCLTRSRICSSLSSRMYRNEKYRAERLLPREIPAGHRNVLSEADKNVMYSIRLLAFDSWSLEITAISSRLFHFFNVYSRFTTRLDRSSPNPERRLVHVEDDLHSKLPNRGFVWFRWPRRDKLMRGTNCVPQPMHNNRWFFSKYKPLARIDRTK